MSEHYNSQTLLATAWCRRCHANTLHTISGHRKGSCTRCLERLEKEHRDRAEEIPPKKPPKSDLLF